ncbi:glycosyltransferase [Polaribacter sp. IC073]|uniref:glycosyltransferase n=1 Tax=Polaribacter sp. IC073 TaxID=2508540 RepID=UPI0011BE44FB|nr:glycosyltransferase [Polaribacter sp. IC073]TXD49135.1 glycosyltransferase [Polaribacter sp. IC073]
MRKVGVIQVIDSLNTGGAEVLAVNIANSLSQKGLNSHMCATRKEGDLKDNIDRSVGYLFLNRQKVIDIKAFINFRKYTKANNISIVHAHATSFFFAVCMKLIHWKLKIVWHDHYGKSQDLSLRPSAVLKISSFFLNTIISVNNDLKDWAQHKLFCKDVLFLNNFALFRNLDEETTLQGSGGNRIIHLAAFRVQKDHENLINAFLSFLKRNPTWTLHLVGQLNNTAYSRKILQLIKDLKLEKHIFVYDSCLDIKHILKQSNIGVLSSKSEGLPLALLEYGLAKLPVVVTNVGECAKVVENNKSGIVVTSNNSLELEEALHILANSKEKRVLFGEQHHKNVTEKYSEEKFMNQLLKIYTR